jgi:hypothetical protein
MGTKALLVGINAYPTMPLNGCVNDVVNMRTLLQQRFNVADANVRVLLDAQATKTGIEDGLRWLAEPDDDGAPVRLFHFSGHGTFVDDQNSDEPDGCDEALVPFDYTSVGGISDDSLRVLYDRFRADTHLLLVMDCCHSGSIQRAVSEDVRFRFLPNSREERRRFDERARQVLDKRDAYVMEQLRDLRGQAVDDDEWQRRVRASINAFEKKHFGIDTVPGNVVLLSACRADQTAADAKFDTAYNGAFTYHLTRALNASGGIINYNALIAQVGRSLEDDRFLQEPQLECSTTSRECGFLNVSL